MNCNTDNNKKIYYVLIAFQMIVFAILVIGLKQSIPTRRWIYIIAGVVLVIAAIIVRKPVRKIYDNLSLNNDVLREIIAILTYAVISAFILLAFDMVHTRTIGWMLQGFRIYSNLLVCLGLLLVARAVFVRESVSVFVVSTALFVLNLASYYVFLFRGMPIVPWDIYAFGTARDVASNYTLFSDEYMIYAWILTCVAQWISLWIEDYSLKEKRCIKRIVLLAETGVILAVFLLSVQPRLWIWMVDIQHAYEQEGVLAGFVAHIQATKYEQPAGYTEETIREMLETGGMDTTDSQIAAIKPKNIIVVMNESFADLSCLGTELEADYMPFLHGLEDNTIRGTLVVPTFGGGTCDTEFEVLSGLSCRYNLHYPYVTALHNEVPSFVRTLQKSGFYCEAYHPGELRNWNRGEAYRQLGFEEFTVLPEDTQGVPFTNGYACDSYDYEQVMQHFEDRDKTKPYFLFNVTIQNHGGYTGTRDGVEFTEEARKYEEYPDVMEYLSLVQESDEQLEHLITYFEDTDEPTMVCFFGDHLPKLSEAFFEEQEKDNTDVFHRYETPMIIWTNYDIDEQDLGRISSNYLATMLLHYSGYEFSELDDYLWKLYQEYPVVSPFGIMRKDGTMVDTVPEDDVLGQYDDIVYYQLKDAMQH